MENPYQIQIKMKKKLKKIFWNYWVKPWYPYSV